MDAATLYMVLTLPNGEQSTSTQKFPTMEACEAQVELLRKGERRQPPLSTYVCEGHNPFTFIAGYGRSRRYSRFPRVKAAMRFDGSPTCATAAPESSATVSRILHRIAIAGGSDRAWTLQRSTWC